MNTSISEIIYQFFIYEKTNTEWSRHHKENKWKLKIGNLKYEARSGNKNTVYRV